MNYFYQSKELRMIHDWKLKTMGYFRQTVKTTVIEASEINNIGPVQN
jgi:hypothetical protein